MVTAVEAPREARGGSVRDGAGRVVLSLAATWEPGRRVIGRSPGVSRETRWFRAHLASIPDRSCTRMEALKTQFPHEAVLKL